ncbi:MAG: PilZ domain-containing protein [Planctomycetota bacterium]
MFQEFTDLSPQLASPEDLFDVVSLVYAAVDEKNRTERRITERERAFLPVELQYLDDEFNPVGEEFEAMSRDVSVGGVGVLTSTDATLPKAILRFPTLETLPIMCDVRFSKPIGPFFHVGLSFCVDWS